MSLEKRWQLAPYPKSIHFAHGAGQCIDGCPGRLATEDGRKQATNDVPLPPTPSVDALRNAPVILKALAIHVAALLRHCSAATTRGFGMARER